MTTSRDASCRGFHRYWWVPMLVAVLGFVTWDAVTRCRHAALVNGSYGVTVDAPPLDASSPTGYAQGRRSLILPDRSMDGYHWIMQAQTMVAEGGWRVRHVDYDHAPRGREVHWAGPFRWCLVFLAWIERLASGDALGVAIERAALVSGPVLLALLLMGTTPWLAARFGPSAAAWSALMTVATLPFYVDFVAGYPDHHGLVNACGLWSSLCLLAAGTPVRPGAVGDPVAEFAAARRWVVASAVAAGLGLWISAATVVPVLVGCGLGGGAAGWLGRRGGAAASVWTRHPRLFRIWGATGAAVSGAAYLVEYFPAHLGMRLEVNHPLYALAWFGGGEALCRLTRLLGAESPVAPGADRRAFALAAAAVAVLPLVILLTKPDTFLVADPFVWRLHNHFISEFESLPAFLAGQHLGWTSLGQCLPLLILGPALALVGQTRRPGDSRARLALALLPALFVLPLMWSQIRWWSLEYALLLPVLVATVQAIETDGPGPRRRAGVALGCALLFAPGAVAAVQQVLHSRELVAEDIQALAERDLAHWLRQRAGAGRVVVAGSPTVTTSLIFGGSLTGVGTLYWENAGGLKDAAALYAAPTAEAARAVVQRCGITHIVIVSWDGFEGAYTRLARGLPKSAPLTEDAFIVRLLKASVPPGWLQLVPFHLPTHPALDGQQIRIYEVTPDQSPAGALLRAADYYVEMGLLDPAGQMAAALNAPGENLAACALIAEIASRRGDAPGFTRAIERVVAHLPEAKALPLEDRVRVAAALATARQFDAAGGELQACLGQLTEAGLRRLPAGTLANLLALVKAAGAEWPDPALQKLAADLLPPSLRK